MSSSASRSNTRSRGARSPTRSAASTGNSRNASTATSSNTSSSSGQKDPITKPGAYAVTQTTSGPAQVLRVQVPNGVRPGSEFTVQPQNPRRTVRVRCPITSGPGKTLQITIPPEPITERKQLKPAKLTAAQGKGAGGAKTMTPEVLKGNEKRMEKYREWKQKYEQQELENASKSNLPSIEELEGSSSSLKDTSSKEDSPKQASQPKAYLITIPPKIQPGDPFTIDVQGKRYVINCPPNAGPGQKVKIVPPRSRANSGTNNDSSQTGNRSRANSGGSITQRRQRADSVDDTGEYLEENSESSHSNSNNNSNNENPENKPAQKLQMFEVRVPSGVEPGQPFALLANGQRVLVTCPPKVQVGQKIRFNLPVTAQMVQNIQLQYEGSASGWCRTIRVNDLKFQWVRVTKKGFARSPPGTTSTAPMEDDSMMSQWDESRRLLDVNAMNDFDFSKSAYGRHLTLLKGNDVRLRTGILSWVPAKDATVDSKLVLHQKVLLSYADIASEQQKPFQEKLLWFEETLSKLLLIPWEEGHVKIMLRRPYLLQDSVDAIMSLSRTQLRQRWRMEIQNEPAVDAGGVTREWFQLVTQQIFDPNFGLWMSSANNQACSTINPTSGT